MIIGSLISSFILEERQETYIKISNGFLFNLVQDCEIKEEGTKHMLILYNVRMDQVGGVDFQAANAKSNAQLRVKGEFRGMLLGICFDMD